MVAADGDILARLNLRAALSDDDHAGARSCAVGELYPEIFRVRGVEVLC